MLGARHTRAPTATKRRAAHQQSVPGETQSSSGVEIALLANRGFMQQPVTTGLTKISDKQIAKGKCRNVTNRNQGNMAASKPNSLTTGIPVFPNIPEKQDLDLKLKVRIKKVKISQGPGLKETNSPGKG